MYLVIPCLRKIATLQIELMTNFFSNDPAAPPKKLLALKLVSGSKSLYEEYIFDVIKSTELQMASSPVLPTIIELKSVGTLSSLCSINKLNYWMEIKNLEEFGMKKSKLSKFETFRREKKE